MALGNMTEFISIIETRTVKDADGFSVNEDVTLASVRAYREGRHGSRRWANRASFTDATDLFRFRVIPGVEVTVAQTILCGTHRFEITSVEDVKGRGMYIEVLCREVKANG